ncbi:MAG: SCP2 sterol-binding domain-containing protein [Nitrososphaerota archaeon]|jgi:putative sterol carrier protein|nr:SCP2 sterol-binding domain-containing protein [Nitrososphaerota archaeon]MDG7037982.1 SCP2 sterol-binding domain-containing protein [Nitrososphaerota archaeon]MDG7040333.1 SCP2 sterol-binding domain-containing protein [Nitrososphaerota archaeon]MDG7041619.1 SCP2 sterol-binding domain-containing protein [Nitrososphaerota archaeon]MDG7042975.1 SCP2 sterol-binding domain-containing protein [Nitrososphaerota archaeon]
MSSYDVFEGVVSRLNSSEKLKQELRQFSGKSFQFKPNSGQEYYVNFKDDGSAELLKGTGQRQDAVISADDGILSDVMTGKADAVRAFLMGKLKVSGDLFLSQKLVSVVKKATQ